MSVIIIVFDTKTFGTVGIVCATVYAKTAYFTLFDFTEGNTAVLTYMIVPITALYTKFTAGAAKVCNVVLTTFFTETAYGAKFQFFHKNASVTLFTDNAAFFAMISFIFASSM